MEWLTQVPFRLVRQLLARIPQLQAVESQLAYMRIAMGNGLVEKSASRSLLRDWTRDAEGPEARPRAPQAHTDERLRGMGIAVVTVKGNEDVGTT